MAQQDGVFVDAKELASMNKMFQEAPKDIKKELRKAWGKDSRKVVKIIKSVGFSRSGPSSVGKGPGDKYGHLKTNVKATRVKVGGKKWMWAWLRIGIKGQGGQFGDVGKSFVGLFHEFGTGFGKRRGNLPKGAPRGGARRSRGEQGRTAPARAPMATGWAAAKTSVNFVASADKAIAAGLEKAAKRS